MELIPKTVRAPEIGQQWINSPPLSLRGLKGQVVLVDFWDYTCVNCLRTLPYLKGWHEKYRDHGLQIIGIHAPEFEFSRTRDHVERAVREFGIEYPVMLDNDYQAWQAFANKAWPARYLIDQDGYIRYYQLGEGGYQDFERALQELLSDRDPGRKLPPLMPLVRELDEPGRLAHCRMPTPELYCGTARGRYVNEGGLRENDLASYRYALSPPPPHELELEGWWLATREYVESQDAAGARLRLQFEAAEVNAVMSGPGEVTVSVDGRPERTIRVITPGMFRLIEGDRFREGILEIESATPGLRVYAFTFVTCVGG